MPKPTGKKKYSGSGYGEKDFQRELVQADKRQLQEKRARRKDAAGKTQRMNELNKQYREINSYVGPELPGDRAARERGYYANLAQYGSDYGDQAAYDSGYQRYKAAMQSIETAGAQTARTAAGTARMSQAGDMIQDVLRRGKRPFEMLGGRREADFAAEDLALQGSRLDRDRRTYTQMARGAQMAGDREMLRSARQGLADSSGRYADAMAAYGEKIRGARDSYLRELEQTNKGAYYGETHGTQEIEGRLRDLRRKREQLDSMDVTWTDGMGGPAESKQDYVSARGQELDAEIAQWEAALRHRNAIDKADEMRRVAESITNAPNFRELSEVGRAMVEGRNKQAKDSAIYPEEPEDPDNWRNYQRYLQKEKEALAQAGYVADLDSSYIPEDVKPVYYALFAQNPQKAREWAEYWQGVGEDEYWRQIYEASGEDAGSRLGAFIQGTFANTVAGLNPFGEGGQYAAKLGSTMIGGGAAGLTEKGLFNTGALAGEIDVPIFGKQTLGNAYQLGSSMLQSAANATLAKMTGGAAEIVGGMGTILLGSSAAAQDYQQKLEQGWDESSAKWHALAAGAAEAGFEYLSLDKLVNQDVSRGFIRNVLLQGGIEASEEVSTTIANRISDAAISVWSGYDNSIQQRAKELMSFGYEAGTADKMAQQEWLTELLNDALGGFLSGGLMTGGQYAMLPVYKAIGAVDDFNRFTRTLSSTGETAITETAELTRGKAGALARQIGASLNAETVEAARRIMGEEVTDSSTALRSAQNDAGKEAQSSVDGGQIARATEQNDGGDVAVNDRRYDGQNDNVERGTGNPSPTEQKQSRREQRRQAREQQKQSTRDGAVYEQAVQKIRQAIDQRGVGAVNEVYAETVEQYGEAAKGIAQEAITRAVSRQLSEARNVADIDRMTQAENAAPEVRAAIQQAKDLRSYQLFAQNGDTEAAERAIQSRRNSGRGSGALRLEAEYSGEDGSVKRAEITGVTANAESVKLSNGETVSVKQLANLDADTRDVLDRIAYMEVGPAADILWKSYLAEAGSGTDGYRYVMDWATAYDQGRQGSVSLKEAQGRSSLSAETVKNAYELGEQYGKDLDAKQKAELAEKMKITQKGATGRAGSVNTEQIGGMKLSEDQSKQLEIVKRLAEAFGIDVEVFASGTKEVTANGETKRQFVGENGRYQDGKIWLDINAGLNYTDDIGSGLVATMGHELTHFIQEYAPEEYRAYKRFVLATIRQQEGSQGLERLIREKIQRSKGQNLSRSAAEDEVVADAAQTVLTDSQALQQMAEQEPTLFRKVLDWIKDFFDSIREALSSSPRMSEEARLFRALEADVRKTFGELWDKGITEAVRVHDQVGSLEGESQGQNSERDAEYLELAKDPEKNLERLQEMVDEAAKNAGYVLSAFHGTAERFNVFRRGLEGIHLGNERQARQRAKIASEKAERSRYSWSDVRKRLQEFNQDTITSLVRIAHNTVAWGADWETEPQHFDGDTKNLNAVRNYIDDMAEQYAKGTDGRALDFLLPTFDRDVRPNMMDLYARISNPLKVDHDILEWTTPNIARMLIEAARGNGKEFVVDGGKAVDISTSRIDFTDEELERLESIKGFDNDANWDTIADILAAHGYDGIQYVNEYEGDRKSPSYIALRPSDVKRADPVTYDDSGNVIPLSERFNTKNPDIRYSERTRLEGQMGLFGDQDGGEQAGLFGQDTKPQGGTQTSMFGTTERTTKAQKPKAPTSGELFVRAFDDFLRAKKAIRGGKWYGNEFDDFFRQNPKMDFVSRFMADDQRVRQDMRDFLATIDDMEKLDGMSWYTTQSPSVSRKAGYRSALTKVRNEYKRRINEIAAQKAGGHEIKLTRGKYSFEQVEALFRQLNSNEAVAKLAEKVFPVAKELGLDFYATNRIFGEQKSKVKGSNFGKDVFLKINAFADKALTDQYKASVILHEMIHACTVYALSDFYDWRGNTKDSLTDGIQQLYTIYGQARGEKSLAGSYGMTNIREFVAELAQPEFREKLEKVSLLERVLDAIKRFFGIEKVKGSSYLDSASAALDYLIDEIDRDALREYYADSERQAKAWEQQKGMTRYSERDYSLPSDLELMDRAAESLSEAGGEEYWKALLEAAPELAEDKAELKSMAKAYREQSRKLDEAEKKLAEARQQLVTTDRKLRTRGISGVTTNILKDLHAGDVKNRNVQQTVTDILTKAYQKGLDAIDAGKSQSEVWDVVYNEGIVKAADYILENATYSEKTSRKWTTVILNKYMTGEEGRYAVLDAISARVVPDWWESRARQPLQQTAADRIVSRVEGRMQKQIDAQTQRAESAEASNRKLREDLDFYKEAQDNAAKQVTFLGKRLEEARADMKDVKQADAKERRQKTARIRSLENQLKAKREEAGAWKQMASRNESLLRAALKSKNADLEAQVQRADKAEAALAGQTVNAKAWERNADLYAKQLDKQLEQKVKIVKQLEAQVQREKDILSGKLKPLAMQRLLAAAREEAASKAKEKKEEVFQNYKERKTQTAIRNRIKNLHAEMQRDLLKPREGHFVPEALIRPVVELLDMVNTQTNRAKSESAQAKIDAINAQYDKLKNDERYSQYYDETVKDMLVELSSTLNGRSIYELNSDELADVYTAMKAMRTTIRNAIRADLVEKGKEIWEIGNELRQELRQGKGAHAYLLEKYHMSMLNAQRAFNRFGGYRQGSTWNKMYRMLDNAQLDMLRIEMEATRLFDPVLKAKADFEKAQNLTSLEKGALVDVGLRDENGRSVWITRGMMLSLYMHLQNEQNMKHLMYGGLTLPDFKRYYNGNPEAWGRGTVEIPALGARVSNLEQLLEEQGEEWVRSQYKTMEEDIKKMFESVRESIEKQMTDYDRKWIEASKDFFDNFSRRELNRVTNSMYGFSKAKVDNYFPIVTDSNFLKSEFDSISRNVSLENAGFMKERVKASNPILLEDITRTVNRQISNVSRYAGLTEALKQFGNIYNVQTKGFTDSVKKAMAKSYGKTGQEYIQNLITDMVGGRSTPGTIFDRIKGNYAQAVLSANLSVTIKQAASYPTAAATVGWKPLMKALAKGGRNNRVFSRADRALIDTYSPLLWKRSQGAIDTEIGDMAHAQDWTKKAKWLMGWIEKTDIATVGRLWYAAEYYVKDNFKGLEKGTAEQIQNGESPFYQKVSEIFNRIVEETQPNYTVLQRPDILRNPNKLLRSLVMFSTQRFQNGQILMDAAAEYGAMRSLDRKGSTEKTKAARREAKRKLTWAITSQAVSAVVLNAMTLLAGAVMHRMNPWRDDDDEITLESTAGALMDGWVESLAGSFLGGSEIYEALDSLLTGSTYYGNDVGGLSSINDFSSAIITMGQKAVKLVGDENSKPEDWAKLAKTQLWKVGEYLSQMTGVPAANIRKILEGASLHVQDAMETHLFSYEAGLARSNATNARRYAEAWEAGDMEKMQAVIAEMNRNLEKAGKSTDGARDAITKAAKERYEAGEIELAQYADFLRQAGYLEEDKIESKIRDFLRDELVTGDRTEDEVLRLLTELGGLTEDKAWKKVMEWKAKAETGDSEEEDDAAKYSEYDALRDALRSGQKLKDAAKDYLAHGYTEKQVLDAATKDLKARFQAGEVSEDKAIDLLVEYSGKDEDACWKTVQGWIGAMEHPEDEDYSWGQYDAIDEALAGNKEVKGLISELTAHGVKEENVTKHIKEQLVQNYVDGKTNESQLKNQLSRYLGIVAKADVDKILKDANTKKLYGVAYSSLDEEYRAGKIGKAEIKQALMQQGGLSSGEAEQKIRWYDLQKANPKLEISEAVCNAWYDGTTGYSQKYGHESAKDAGMSIERYLEARKYLDAVKDANGNNTGEDEVIQALAGMSGLTAREKDALYYERYKGGARKGIYKTW